MIKKIFSVAVLVFLTGTLIGTGTADTGNYYADYYGKYGTKLNTNFSMDYPEYFDAKFDPNTGLTVSSTPGGAEIFVNDESMGVTRILKNKVISGLIPGDYTINLTYPGYTNYTTSFPLADGEVKTIEAVLAQKEKV
ncbi:PEGA domain-containing protein [Methanospirillum stamsii]|uniref:PEGA domain-containing protein n=1 Tax=Methanospirillum stamsii TaxID=1277351 RepID=A0A2V2N4Q5_9EURY|nr:PEGA domain-containing protein [Methanospirillum stamsii]PWR70481.1 hypothetical protein DLD82_15530 [Methanospirillum stamsii]